MIDSIVAALRLTLLMSKKLRTSVLLGFNQPFLPSKFRPLFLAVDRP